MDRLDQDLRYFKLELEQENDAFRQNLLLQEIARVEQCILNLMRQERNHIDQENRNMSAALEIIRKQEQKK